MGKLIINVATTLNGAFEAPAPAPHGWLALDADSQRASLEMWQAAEAMVLGRKTYEGLSAIWPQLADVPGYEAYAQRMNTLPKYVASRTLNGAPDWNSKLLDGELAASINDLKAACSGNLIVTGAGELARSLITQNLVDEFLFTLNPTLWPSGPQIFANLGAIPLELISSTAFAGGIVQLRYRPAAASTG